MGMSVKEQRSDVRRKARNATTGVSKKEEHKISDGFSIANNYRTERDKSTDLHITGITNLFSDKDISAEQLKNINNVLKQVQYNKQGNNSTELLTSESAVTILNALYEYIKTNKIIDGFSIGTLLAAIINMLVRTIDHEFSTGDNLIVTKANIDKITAELDSAIECKNIIPTYKALAANKDQLVKLHKLLLIQQNLNDGMSTTDALKHANAATFSQLTELQNAYKALSNNDIKNIKTKLESFNSALAAVETEFNGLDVKAALGKASLLEIMSELETIPALTNLQLNLDTFAINAATIRAAQNLLACAGIENITLPKQAAVVEQDAQPAEINNDCNTLKDALTKQLNDIEISATDNTKNAPLSAITAKNAAANITALCASYRVPLLVSVDSNTNLLVSVHSDNNANANANSNDNQPVQSPKRAKITAEFTAFVALEQATKQGLLNAEQNNITDQAIALFTQGFNAQATATNAVEVQDAKEIVDGQAGADGNAANQPAAPIVKPPHPAIHKQLTTYQASLTQLKTAIDSATDLAEKSSLQLTEIKTSINVAQGAAQAAFATITTTYESSYNKAALTLSYGAVKIMNDARIEAVIVSLSSIKKQQDALTKSIKEAKDLQKTHNNDFTTEKVKENLRTNCSLNGTAPDMSEALTELVNKAQQLHDELNNVTDLNNAAIKEKTAALTQEHTNITAAIAAKKQDLAIIQADAVGDKATPTLNDAEVVIAIKSALADKGIIKEHIEHQVVTDAIAAVNAAFTTLKATDTAIATAYQNNEDTAAALKQRTENLATLTAALTNIDKSFSLKTLHNKALAGQQPAAPAQAQSAQDALAYCMLFQNNKQDIEVLRSKHKSKDAHNNTLEQLITQAKTLSTSIHQPTLDKLLTNQQIQDELTALQTQVQTLLDSLILENNKKKPPINISTVHLYVALDGKDKMKDLFVLCCPDGTIGINDDYKQALGKALQDYDQATAVDAYKLTNNQQLEILRTLKANIETAKNTSTDAINNALNNVTNDGNHVLFTGIVQKIAELRTNNLAAHLVEVTARLNLLQQLADLKDKHTAEFTDKAIKARTELKLGNISPTTLPQDLAAAIAAAQTLHDNINAKDDNQVITRAISTLKAKHTAITKLIKERAAVATECANVTAISDHITVDLITDHLVLTGSTAAAAATYAQALAATMQQAKTAHTAMHTAYIEGKKGQDIQNVIKAAKDSLAAFNTELTKKDLSQDKLTVISEKECKALAAIKAAETNALASINQARALAQSNAIQSLQTIADKLTPQNTAAHNDQNKADSSPHNQLVHQLLAAKAELEQLKSNDTLPTTTEELNKLQRDTRGLSFHTTLKTAFGINDTNTETVNKDLTAFLVTLASATAHQKMRAVNDIVQTHAANTIKTDQVTAFTNACTAFDALVTEQLEYNDAKTTQPDTNKLTDSHVAMVDNLNKLNLPSALQAACLMAAESVLQSSKTQVENHIQAIKLALTATLRAQIQILNEQANNTYRLLKKPTAPAITTNTATNTESFSKATQQSLPNPSVTATSELADTQLSAPAILKTGTNITVKHKRPRKQQASAEKNTKKSNAVIIAPAGQLLIVGLSKQYTMPYCTAQAVAFSTQIESAEIKLTALKNKIERDYDISDIENFIQDVKSLNTEIGEIITKAQITDEDITQQHEQQELANHAIHDATETTKVMDKDVSNDNHAFDLSDQELALVTTIQSNKKVEQLAQSIINSPTITSLSTHIPVQPKKIMSVEDFFTAAAADHKFVSDITTKEAESLALLKQIIAFKPNAQDTNQDTINSNIESVKRAAETLNTNYDNGSLTLITSFYEQVQAIKLRLDEALANTQSGTLGTYAALFLMKQDNKYKTATEAFSLIQETIAKALLNSTKNIIAAANNYDAQSIMMSVVLGSDDWINNLDIKYNSLLSEVADINKKLTEANQELINAFLNAVKLIHDAKIAAYKEQCQQFKQKHDLASQQLALIAIVDSKFVKNNQAPTEDKGDNTAATFKKIEDTYNAVIATYNKPVSEQQNIKLETLRQLVEADQRNKLTALNPSLVERDTTLSHHEKFSKAIARDMVELNKAARGQNGWTSAINTALDEYKKALEVVTNATCHSKEDIEKLNQASTHCLTVVSDFTSKANAFDSDFARINIVTMQAYLDIHNSNNQLNKQSTITHLTSILLARATALEQIANQQGDSKTAAKTAETNTKAMEDALKAHQVKRDLALMKLDNIQQTVKNQHNAQQARLKKLIAQIGLLVPKLLAVNPQLVVDHAYNQTNHSNNEKTASFYAFIESILTFMGNSDQNDINLTIENKQKELNDIISVANTLTEQLQEFNIGLSSMVTALTAELQLAAAVQEQTAIVVQNITSFSSAADKAKPALLTNINRAILQLEQMNMTRLNHIPEKCKDSVFKEHKAKLEQIKLEIKRIQQLENEHIVYIRLGKEIKEARNELALTQARVYVGNVEQMTNQELTKHSCSVIEITKQQQDIINKQNTFNCSNLVTKLSEIVNNPQIDALQQFQKQLAITWMQMFGATTRTSVDRSQNTTVSEVSKEDFTDLYQTINKQAASLLFLILPAVTFYPQKKQLTIPIRATVNQGSASKHEVLPDNIADAVEYGWINLQNNFGDSPLTDIATNLLQLNKLADENIARLELEQKQNMQIIMNAQNQANVLVNDNTQQEAKLNITKSATNFMSENVQLSAEIIAAITSSYEIAEPRALLSALLLKIADAETNTISISTLTSEQKKILGIDKADSTITVSDLIAKINNLETLVIVWNLFFAVTQDKAAALGERIDLFLLMLRTRKQTVAAMKETISKINNAGCYMLSKFPDLYTLKCSSIDKENQQNAAKNGASLIAQQHKALNIHNNTNDEILKQEMAVALASNNKAAYSTVPISIFPDNIKEYLQSIIRIRVTALQESLKDSRLEFSRKKIQQEIERFNKEPILVTLDDLIGFFLTAENDYKVHYQSKRGILGVGFFNIENESTKPMLNKVRNLASAIQYFMAYTLHGTVKDNSEKQHQNQYAMPETIKTHEQIVAWVWFLLSAPTNDWVTSSEHAALELIDTESLDMREYQEAKQRTNQELILAKFNQLKAKRSDLIGDTLVPNTNISPADVFIQAQLMQQFAATKEDDLLRSSISQESQTFLRTSVTNSASKTDSVDANNRQNTLRSN